MLGDNTARKSNPFLMYLNQIENTEIKNFEKRYNKRKNGLLVFSKAFYPIYCMVKFNDMSEYSYNNLDYMVITLDSNKYLVFEFNSFLSLFGDING